jgi:hypothetical protein
VCVCVCVCGDFNRRISRKVPPQNTYKYHAQGATFDAPKLLFDGIIALSARSDH